ncbi:MAG: histidine phosphatase family protein, partial [Parahaliea sp.]
MSTLYLIRHGQASFGADDYDKLSERGCRQADMVGRYFAEQGVKLDAAYSGDLLRQRETAQSVLAHQGHEVPYRIDPRFNEVHNDEHLEHLVPEVQQVNPGLKRL